MDLTTFIQQFGTERKCEKFVQSQREKHGVICTCCSKKVSNWRSVQKYWRCSCGNKISLKAGTLMESSKLSLAVWFKAMFLMTHVKKSYSILELSRILGINRYRTVWYLSMKLRVGMGQDLLGKEYFQFLYLISKAKAQTSQLKAIQNYSISAILKSKIYKRDEINLIAPVDVLKKVEVEEFNLKRKGYRCLKVFGVQRKIELKEVHYAVKPDVQLWLSTLVANSNRMLNGIHHGVSFLHLQKYMFEYSFNYNLRSQDKFEKLKNCVLF